MNAERHGHPWDDLAQRALSGDNAAWSRLVEGLWPILERIVGASRSMGGLRRSEDHVRNVVTSIIEKMGGGGRRGLSLYFPWRLRNVEKTFEDWLRIVATNAVRDYVRREAGDALSRERAEPSVKRLLNEFRTSPALELLGVRPPITAAQTARELLRFADEKLPTPQLAALRLWLDGATFEEIASEGAGTDAEEARKLVRAAVGTIRRHFAGTPGSG